MERFGDDKRDPGPGKLKFDKKPKWMRKKHRKRVNISRYRTPDFSHRRDDEFLTNEEDNLKNHDGEEIFARKNYTFKEDKYVDYQKLKKKRSRLPFRRKRKKNMKKHREYHAFSME